MRYYGDRLGRFLVGDDLQSTPRLMLRVRLVLTGSLLTANSIGAVVVASLAIVVIPGSSLVGGSAALITFVALPAYIVGALVVGAVVGTRRSVAVLDWVRRDTDPSDAEAAAAFAVPRRLTALQAALWAFACVLFTTLYGLRDARDIPRSAFPIALGGLVVCANSYLLSELSLRPVAARALRTHAPRRRAGVRGRLLLAWGLGSAIPVAGAITVAVFALVRSDITARRLAITELALGLVTLLFGYLLVDLMGRLTVGPIRAVRAGLADVAAGSLDVEVAVYDGTELGELQTGFNAMAGGLRERDLLQDLFGRHVGRSVARAALAAVPELGGEERHVAALFVDVIGSTTLAVDRPPGEVVTLLNRFFAVVVEEVETHGGLINKFIGDAALGVFGAPVELADPAGSALSAARAISARLAAEVPECSAGAAVALGTAIAGNIGTAQRFEYTVIGDPVNEAARLSELAKAAPGRLLASGVAVRSAGGEEAAHWTLLRSERLRGRRSDTEVFAVKGGEEGAGAPTADVEREAVTLPAD